MAASTDQQPSTAAVAAPNDDSALRREPLRAHSPHLGHIELYADGDYQVHAREFRIGRAGVEPVDRTATRDELLVKALDKAGVPPRYHYARFDQYSNGWVDTDGFVPRPGTEAAVEACRRLAGSGGRGSLMLSGAPGSGKTHLAVATLAARALGAVQRQMQYRDDADPILRTQVDWEFQHFASRFSSTPRLLQELRRHIAGDVEDDLLGLHRCDGCSLERLEQAPLLVLDDLGVEKATDWTVDRLTTLVGSRYDNELGTIVTSNYDAEQLADRGYERIVSRLLEDGPHVRIEAPDYRLRARA